MRLVKLIAVASIFLCASFQLVSQQFIDTDGNAYETIVLAGKTWMASNFRCTKTPAGNSMAQGRNSRGGSTYASFYRREAAGDPTEEKNPVFYNWLGALAVCPAGWHIPSEKEWEDLIAYLSVEGNAGAGTIPGAKLLGPSGGSGFNALLAGSWDAGLFFDHGAYAAFWSSTQYPSDSRDMWQFKFTPTAWYKIFIDKRCAFSLRLVKD